MNKQSPLLIWWTVFLEGSAKAQKKGIVWQRIHQETKNLTQNLCAVKPKEAWFPLAVYSVQFSSVTQWSNSMRPHEPQHARSPCPSPTPRVHPNSCPSSQWYHPAISSSVVPFSSCPQSFPASGSFSNESALCIRWPKYQSFSFNISPSNELPGLISFRMDWLDLLAVQGTLKSLLQHHSSKASIHWCSAFFIVQLSKYYMTTGKTIALTRQIFVDKVMSLLFNMFV